MKSVQAEFELLVRTPDKSTAGESLKTVALALWYEDFVPEVKNLRDFEVPQAGYLLDKLTRYNCLDGNKKEMLRSKLLVELRVKKEHFFSESNSGNALLREWGAKAELKREFKGLLHLQRRSYKETSFALTA